MGQANFNSDASTLKYTPAAAVSAGAVVCVGLRALIAKLDMEADRVGALATVGVFDVVKKTGAWTDQQPIYWDPTGDPVSGTAGSGAATTVITAYFLGFARGTAASGDARGAVDLSKPPAEAISTIADPGASGAISVLKSGVMQLVTAAAETRTLARPSFIGQQIQICMKTDGGDGVITVTGGVNMTGNNTLTFDNAGECITLLAKQSGANLAWQVVQNDGVGLTTV